jgi:hypothetical protein
MAKRMLDTLPEGGFLREVGESVILLALIGSSVGGLLGMLAIATHALGR